MRFRLKALGLHLLASATLLTLILGILFLGWYRWPGWYLTDVKHVIFVMIGVDVIVGPLLTFVIASHGKPRRELVRDVAIIVTVQLCALIYGTTSLWNGRPLYYAFSVSVLELVQASDISSTQAALGRRQNAGLAPHWYSRPRWIWAPLPDDPDAAKIIISQAISGGDDVTDMPARYKPWDQGVPALREALKKVDNVAYFAPSEKKLLKQRMQAAGLATDQLNAIPLTGRSHPLLAVFDLTTMQIKAIFRTK
jgi:hypothetical protein